MDNIGSERSGMAVISEKKVGVILSSYNGDRYISQLLDSVFAQTYPAVSLYIRDDGSSDKTIELIKKHPRAMDIHLESGRHRGVVDSFLQLLAKVALCPDIEYIAFCDQDDVWKKDKLSRAVSGLKGIEGAALYFSEYDIVDADLEFIKKSGIVNAESKISFENAIVQNIVPGFTTVLNRTAAVLISENSPSSDRIIMHDWWAYLVVSAFGRVVSDSMATALYRRHDNNAMDTKSSVAVFWKNRIKRYLVKSSHLFPIAGQVQEFKRRFWFMLDDDKKEVVDGFIGACCGGISKRIKYVFNGIIYYQSGIDTMLFKFILLFEKSLKKIQ